MRSKLLKLVVASFSALALSAGRAFAQQNVTVNGTVVDENGELEGILHIRKFLKAKIRGRKALKARSMLDKPFYLPLYMPIDDALDALSSNRSHMAIVQRGDGSIAGIVTVEDILEELVGEIYDEEEGGLPK